MVLGGWALYPCKLTLKRALPAEETFPREDLAAGGAGVGAVTRIGAHACRQAAGLREGLAAGGADVGADRKSVV